MSKSVIYSWEERSYLATVSFPVKRQPTYRPKSSIGLAAKIYGTTHPNPTKYLREIIK